MVLPTYNAAAPYSKTAKPFSWSRTCWNNRMLWGALLGTQVLTILLLCAGGQRDAARGGRGRRGAARRGGGFALAPLSADQLQRAYDPSCVAWRATEGCDLSPERHIQGDLYCFQRVPTTAAGFCECALGRIANPVSCGHAPFTCRDVCAKRFPGANHISARDGPLSLWQLPPCVAWRATASCAVHGRRLSADDKTCDFTIVQDMSGYCECAGGRLAKPVGCEHAPFTCEVACKAGHDIPPPLSPAVAKALPLVITEDEAAVHFAALEPTCVGWRATKECTPFGPRNPDGDRACGTNIPSGMSGFCECSGGMVAAVSGCAHQDLTCGDACARLPHHSRSFMEVPALQDKLQLLLPDTMQWMQSCVGWRETSDCSPEGRREHHLDQACSQLILSTSSGFCECERGRVVHLVSCDNHQPTTCEEECMRPIQAQQQMRQRDEARAVSKVKKRPEGERVLGCLAWRGMASCEGRRRSPVSDHRCDTSIYAGVAGYCECEHGVTTKRVSCADNSGGFTCADECAGLGNPDEIAAQQQQTKAKGITCGPVVEDDDDANTAARLNSESLKAMAALVTATEVHNGHARWLWEEVFRAYGSAMRGDSVVIPGRRDNQVDFVIAGEHMTEREMKRARRQWQRFLKAVPAFDQADTRRMFKGRGIVITGGGLQYMVPAWINIKMLRRAGCELPIELWIITSEIPNRAFEAALVELGVTLRNLDAIYVPNNIGPVEPESPPPVAKAKGKGDGGGGGGRAKDADGDDEGGAGGDAGRRPGEPLMPMLDSYAIKAAAIIFSSFEEVLFLDADNTPLQDPTALFSSAAYTATGAVLWRDFWPSSIAPDFFHIMEMDPERGPDNTHESGQMLLDKRRHWKPIMLALFFNLQAVLYYRLLTDFLGQGDKETFPMAMAVLDAPYTVVSTPVGSAGVFDAKQGRFRGNTMVQEGPEGGLYFMHANLMKWHLMLPGAWPDYKRRWQLVILGSGDGHSTVDFLEATQSLGYDPERAIYDFLRDLRCQRFFRQYARMRQQRFNDHTAIDLGDKPPTGKDDPADPTTYGMHFDAINGILLSQRIQKSRAGTDAKDVHVKKPKKGGEGR